MENGVWRTISGRRIFIKERQFAPRRGLNIDSRKLTQNEFNTVKSYLLKNNIRTESNGVYDYFITFEK